MAAVKAKTPAGAQEQVAGTSAINLNALMGKAQQELRTSKDRAMHAAAYSYIIWSECQTASGNAWFDAAVKAENAQIDADNAKIKKDRSDINKFEEGKLPKTHAIYETGDDPEAKAISAKAKADMIALQALYAGKNAPTAKKTIEIENGVIDFLAVVKLVFKFFTAADASLLSRYATVCSYIHARFAAVVPLNFADIVTALADAGGFEASYKAQTTAKQNTKNNAKGSEVQLMTAKAQAVGKESAKAMAAVQSFDMAVTNVAQGFTVLLARTDGSKVEVLGEAPVTEAQITNLVSAFEAPDATTVPAASAFIGRVLSLGEVVGGVMASTKDGKGQRKLAMRQDHNGKTQLLVSLQKETAGVVVHATPKHDEIQLGSPEGLFVLSQDHLKQLAQRMTHPLYRRFTQIQANSAPTKKNGKDAVSKLSWDLTNAVAVKEGEAAKLERLFWSDFSNSADKPTDIEDAKFSTCLIVSRDALVAFYDEVLAKLKAKDDADNTDTAGQTKKKTRAAKLDYKAGNLTIEIPGKNKSVQAVTAHLDKAVALEFRPTDLAVLVKLLKQQSAAIFYIQIDEGGLLGIKWSDDLGHYAVYVPALQSTGALNPKRISKAQAQANEFWVNLPMPKVNTAPAKRTTVKKPIAA